LKESSIVNRTKKNENFDLDLLVNNQFTPSMAPKEHHYIKEFPERFNEIDAEEREMESM